MAILYSFKENKLEYEDEDEVKIKMIGTGMDKESLEHNLYKNDITSTVIFDEKKLGSSRKFNWMILGAISNQLTHCFFSYLRTRG
ncbi:hypothetical protein Tco_1086362 [Tanacetum coccineum]